MKIVYIEEPGKIAIKEAEMPKPKKEKHCLK